MKKHLLNTALIALGLATLMIPFRWGMVSAPGIPGIKLAAMISPIMFFIYTLICLKRFGKDYKKWIVLLTIALGSSIFEWAAWVLEGVILGGSMHAVFIVELAMRYLMIFMAYVFYITRTKFLKSIIALCSLATVIWMGLVGSEYAIHYKTFGSWTGEINQKIELPLTFQSSTGEVINLNSYQGHYLILDCWNTTCGVCYKKFPDLQNLYDKYKDDPMVKISALHCRYEKNEETYQTGSNILKERGYTFPCLSVDMNDPAIIEAGVKLFPTVLVFSPDSKLVFRGNLEKAERIFNVNGTCLSL